MQLEHPAPPDPERLQRADPEPAPSFGSVLRRLRRRTGFSQEALAERAGLSAQAVSALECGLRRSPHRATLAHLAEALGVDETERAHLEAAARRSRAERSPRSRLPAAPRTLIGRAGESAAIAGLLGGHRLVTITGPGGIGKTSTALAVAQSEAHAFDEGAAFCDAAPLDGVGRLAGAVAAACGLPALRGEPSADALAAALASSSRLLVLDNCEHVIDAAATVARTLLARCPNVTLLVTSRRRLAVAGEAVFALPPLALPPARDAWRLDAARARDFGSVALFAERASNADARFQLSDDNAPCIARICRRLDGLPLAIELAAAHVRVMNAAELERHLETFASRLRDVRRDGHQRHHALRTAFDWSYDLLGQREQRLFRALGTFASSATFDAVCSVGRDADENDADVLGLLAALVDASLVVVERRDGPTRYRLLETTRDYARSRAEACGETAQWASRHLAYLRTTVGAPTLTRDVENVRAALTWALRGGDVAGGADLAARSSSYWQLIGSFAEGAAWIQAFLAALTPAERTVSTRLLIALSFLERNAQRPDAGLEAARSALACATSVGDPQLAFDALRSVAVSCAFLERFDDAERALADAEPMSAASADLRLEWLLAYGWVAKHRRAHGRALEAFAQARELARRIDRREREVAAAVNVAETEHDRGNAAAALTILQDALRDERLRGVDDEILLANIAGYAVACGDREALAASARELWARGPEPECIVPSLPVVAMLEHVALACAPADIERAALLLGYCDAWYRGAALERDATERGSHERLLLAVKERLEPDTLIALLAEGATLDVADAVRLADFGAPR